MVFLKLIGLTALITLANAWSYTILETGTYKLKAKLSANPKTKEITVTNELHFEETSSSTGSVYQMYAQYKGFNLTESDGDRYNYLVCSVINDGEPQPKSLV